MDGAKIFLIDDEGKNVKEMVERPYKTEDILQRLLVLKPDLLPGNQINPENPRRWLLVKQEMGVPDNASGGDRWSLDHLFLDQDGVPTFVECKRASDTRNRREVVAQMLDYAANGLEYWGIDKLRQSAADTAREENYSLTEELEKLIGSRDEEQIEGYWNLVEANLRAGKVRLVFVSDDIPRELRRLVEFLNEKMMDVEVFAVEVKQFLGEGLRAVVPRAIGITEKAREVKTGDGKKKPLSEGEFLEKCSRDTVDFFRDLLRASGEKNFSIYWGTGSFSIRAHIQTEEREYASFLYGWLPNGMDVYLKQLPLSEEESAAFRRDLLDFGIFKESGKWSLQATIDKQTMSQVKKAYEFILDKATASVKSRKR